MNNCVSINQEEVAKLSKELKMDAVVVEAALRDILTENPNSDINEKAIKDYFLKHAVREKDEVLVSAKMQKKLESIDLERIKLHEILNSHKLSKEQKKVIKALSDKLGRYREEVLSEKEQISVSNIKGTSTLHPNVDVDLYVDFRNFGTFLHDVLDMISTWIELPERAKKYTDLNINENLFHEWFTKDLFEKIYDEFQSDPKKSFEINNMTKDSMYKAVFQMADTLQHYIQQGYKILSEVTLIGDAYNNNNLSIVGRADILLVSPEGKVSVLDFKTKKVQYMITKDEKTNNVNINLDGALFWLAKSAYLIESTGKTDTDFIANKRTTFDEWFIQLEMYSNMLKQMGLEVDTANNNIIGLLYQTTPNLEFMGQKLVVFKGHEYYNTARVAIPGVIGERGIQPLFADDGWLQKKLKGFVDTINKILPYEGSNTKEEKKKRKELYDLRPDEAQAEIIMKSVYERAKTNIEAIRKELSTKNYNEEIRALKKEQLEYLKNIVENIDKQKDTKDLSLFRGIIYAKSLSTLKDETIRLGKEFDAIKEDYEKALKEHDKNPTNENKKKYLDLYSRLLEVHKQNKTVGDALGILYNIANDLKSNPKNNIEDDSPIFMNVLKAYGQHTDLLNQFRDATIPMVVKVLQGIGKEAFESTKADLIDAFRVETKKIHEALKKLEKGKLGLVRKLGNKITGKLTKHIVNAPQNPNASEVDLEIARLEKRLEDLNKIIEGLKFDNKSLGDIIKNMQDPTSVLYLGSRTLYTSGNWVDIIEWNKFQASITDQDLGIASVMIMLKNAEAIMNDNFVNDVDLHNLAKSTDNIRKSKNLSIEQLNDKVSERRTVTYYNATTGEVTTSNQLYISKPMSNEYENTYREFQMVKSNLEKEVKKARAEYNEAIKKYTGQSIMTFKQAYDNAKQELFNHTRNMNDWLIKNSNLPYIDAYYKLQSALPEKYRNNINDIYLQLHIISQEDLMMQTDDDVDLIMVLRSEIKRLKQEAKEEDPKYAAILEEMDGMYYGEYNSNRYETLLKNAEIQFADHPELLAKWKERFEITRPNEEWYRLRGVIYDELSSLYGSSDTILSNLFEKRRNIRSRFTYHRVFNPRIMGAEDIAEWEGINSEIATRLEELKQSKSGTTLSPDTKKRIRELNNQLDNLQEKVRSPLYVEELTRRTDLLIERRNEYERVSLIYSSNKTDANLKAYQAAEKVYNNYIIEYGKWYNERHNDKFVDPLVGKFNRNLAQPKDFNYIFRPVIKEHLETIGNPDYFTEWKLKDEAKNPNYIEGIDNIPLPKGVISVGDGLYSLTSEGMHSPNVSQKFKDIVSDPEMKKYYDTLTSYYFKIQDMMIGQKMGYKVPGFSANKIENFKRLGFYNGMRKEIATAIDKHLKFNSGEQDYTENVWGELNNVVRSRFTSQLSEGIQTTDAINAIYKFATEAHYNNSMQEAQPQADGVIEYYNEMINMMKNSHSTNKVIQGEMNKRIKEWESAVDTLEYEKRKYILGQTDDPQNRKIKKQLNLLFQYVSLLRLGFDVTNQVKNFTAGSLQFWIAAGNMSKHYTSRDAIRAYKKIYGLGGFLQHYFEDWGKITDLHDSTMLYRIFNPLQKSMIHYVDEITGGKTRKAVNKYTNFMELGYMVQDRGDTMIGLTTMYAVLSHYKFNVIDPITKQKVLDDKGNPIQVSADECYVKATDGTLQIRNDVDYTKDDQLRLKRIVISEMRKSQGNYASSDQTRMEAKTLGKLMFFYRKYLLPLLINRFGTLRPSWETGEASLGYWRALTQAYSAFGYGATLKQFFLGNFKGEAFDGLTKIVDITSPTDDTHIEHKMGALYARKINQAARDALAMTIVMSLSMMALAFLKRRKIDDDEPIDMLTGNAIRILWGTAGEALSMFPIGMGSQEYIKNFTTALPMVSEVIKLSKVLDHILKYMLVMITNGGAEPDPEYDSETYQQWYKGAYYTTKSGPYEKGTLKLKKDFVDFTGYGNIRDLFHPENRLETMQKMF